MQTLRTLFPLLVYVLRDRIGWSAVQLGELAFALFLTSFLAAWLRRLLGPERLLAVTAAGLGLLRLAFQLWPGDPLIDLYLAIAATVLFGLYLPTHLGHVRGRGTAAAGLFAIGLLAGLALDTALHGIFTTYDMSWRNDMATTLLLLLLVLGQWRLLSGALTDTAEPPVTASDTTFGLAVTWLALGPFLFLQLLIFQNVARLAALTGWTLPLSFGWVLLSHVLGVGAAIWLLQRLPGRAWLVAAVLGLLLFATLLFPWPGGLASAFLLGAGQLCAALLLALIITGLGSGQARSGLARLTIGHGLGMLLMTVLIFLYYSGFDITLPLTNTILPPIAAVIIGLAGIRAAFALSGPRQAVPLSPYPALFTPLLLLLPLLQLLLWQPPATTIGDGYPARVMTYNLHNGFDTGGDLGMEAIAQVIEAQQADVVGLQEVSRGWVINGSLDMLTWLSRRLEMPYVYGPTADPLWGNAILSRYPILAEEQVDLPPHNLLLGRGFIFARIDLGNGQHLDLIDTHYHQIGADSDVRVMQSQAILDYWQQEERTLIMGDLNAQPDDPEIEMLRQAGLADALEVGGVTPGFTYPAPDPARRIDYIWLSPDLSAGNVVIPPATASDHRGIATTVNTP
jgi:endonuclease/exonuclease/phosphatase family metal-dependent hydrolase